MIDLRHVYSKKMMSPPALEDVGHHLRERVSSSYRNNGFIPKENHYLW